MKPNKDTASINNIYNNILRVSGLNVHNGLITVFMERTIDFHNMHFYDSDNVELVRKILTELNSKIRIIDWRK